MVYLPNKRAARRDQAAFTILELLVVGLIFAGIMALTSVLFLSGRDAVKLSSDKIDTAGRSRRAMDSLTPLVASSVEVGGFAALEVADTTPSVLTDACHIDITTREDFLAANYSPNTPFDVQGPYYRFRVLYDPAAQELRLNQLNLVPVAIDSSVRPRLLARNVLGCRFESLTPGSVGVTLEMKAEQDDVRRPGGVTKSTLNTILISPGSR